MSSPSSSQARIGTMRWLELNHESCNVPEEIRSRETAVSILDKRNERLRDAMVNLTARNYGLSEMFCIMTLPTTGKTSDTIGCVIATAEAQDHGDNGGLTLKSFLVGDGPDSCPRYNPTWDLETNLSVYCSLRSRHLNKCAEALGRQETAAILAARSDELGVGDTNGPTGPADENTDAGNTAEAVPTANTGAEAVVIPENKGDRDGNGQSRSSEPRRPAPPKKRRKRARAMEGRDNSEWCSSKEAIDLGLKMVNRAIEMFGAHSSKFPSQRQLQTERMSTSKQQRARYFLQHHQAIRVKPSTQLMKPRFENLGTLRHFLQGLRPSASS